MPRSSAPLAEFPRGLSQDHFHVYLCGEAWTLLPTDQPDFTLRQYAGLGTFASAPGRERMAEWGVLLPSCRRLIKQSLRTFRPVSQPQPPMGTWRASVQLPARREDTCTSPWPWMRRRGPCAECEIEFTAGRSNWSDTARGAWPFTINGGWARPSARL